MQRNPFARGEYVRMAFSHSHCLCAWCGQAKPRLYAYAWSPDDRPISKSNVPTRRKFCNFNCFKSYYS